MIIKLTGRTPVKDSSGWWGGGGGERNDVSC